MDILRVVLLAASALPLFLFAVFYITEPVKGGPWWNRRFSKDWLATPFGPVWLSQKLAFLALILSIGSFFLFGDYSFRRGLTDLLYTILIGLFWAHFLLLRRVQKQNNPNERKHQK